MNLDLFLTTDCNMRCTFCGAWKQDNAATYLPTERAKSILDDGRTYGFKFTTLSGGEPLMHPDLAEIIDHADRSGYWINITTNGLLIDKPFLDSIRNRKVNLRVSLHTLDADEHRKLTGTDTFARLMDVVDLLKSERFYYSIGSTIHQGNVDSMEALADFAFKNNAAFIRFTPVAQVFKGRDFSLDEAFYERMLRTIIALDKRYLRALRYEKQAMGRLVQPLNIMLTKRCPAGSRLFMIVDASQELVLCQFIPLDSGYPHFPYRGVEDFERLRKAMDAVFQKVRDQGMRGECSACAFQYSCYGGCLGSRLPIGLDERDTPPVCMRKLLGKLVEELADADMDEVMAYWLYHFNSRTSGDDSNLSCMRKLPMWELNFKHGVPRN